MTRRQGRAQLVAPVQARSRETVQRLFDAADALFAERGLDGTSIADIVRRADSGIGTFYGRFRDKAAFVDVFCRRFFESARSRAIHVVSPEAMPAHSTPEFARAFAAYRVDHYERHHRLLHAVVAHMRAKGSPELRSLAGRFGREFRDLVAGRLQSLPDRHAWNATARNVSIALTMIDAVLKEKYVFGGGGLIAPAITRTELSDRLTQLFLDCVRSDRQLP